MLIKYHWKARVRQPDRTARALQIILERPVAFFQHEELEIRHEVLEGVCLYVLLEYLCLSKNE